MNFIQSLDFSEDIIALFLSQDLLFAPFFLLLVEESGLPLPLPGDIIITLIGYHASVGRISYLLAFVLLVMATLIGSSILYFLSAHYGQAFVLKLGKYIHLDQNKLLLVEEKFKRHGFWVIIIGRHIPGFRIPITIFSGMSSVTYKTFITSTAISVIPWIIFYLWLGGRLGPKVKELINQHQGYALFFLVPIFILLLLFVLQILKMNWKKKD